MNLQELLKEFLEEERITELLDKMKTNKIFTASEENLDTRYSKLKGDYDGVVAERDNANKLIADLKKTNAGNEELQGKITTYETQLAELQKENEQLKIDSEMKIELLAKKAKADDIDYLMFRIKQDTDKEIKLDENGKLKGFDEVLDGLKVSYPNNFEVSSKKEVDELLLPKGEDKKSTITKEQFDKMGYKERMELMNNDPDTYNELKKQ